MGAGHRRGRFQVIYEARRTIHEHPHRPSLTPQREGTGRSGWVSGRKAKQSGHPPAEARHRTPTAPRSGPARRQAQRRQTTTAGKPKMWGAKPSAAERTA
ncbi:hypothetical protein HOK021_29320 [Streptomyces hygroscopicus]|nr:hypothetical protein HOK021_29320 [Streptomyces hygroscopicus]